MRVFSSPGIVREGVSKEETVCHSRQHREAAPWLRWLAGSERLQMGFECAQKLSKINSKEPRSMVPMGAVLRSNSEVLASSVDLAAGAGLLGPCERFALHPVMETFSNISP